MGKKKCKKIVLIKGSEVGFDKLEIKKMNNTELLNILKSTYIYFKAKTRQKIKKSHLYRKNDTFGTFPKKRFIFNVNSTKSKKSKDSWSVINEDSKGRNALTPLPKCEP
jgi:hypothetical protein